MIDSITNNAAQQLYMDNQGQRQVERSDSTQTDRAYKGASATIKQDADSTHKQPAVTSVHRKNKYVANSSKRASKVQCRSCSERKYQDQSSDAGVAVKSSSKATTTAADVTVRTQGSHYAAASQAKTNQNTSKTTGSTQAQYSICPECGRPYCSGGTNKTTLLPPAGFTDSARNSSDNQPQNIDAYA